MSTETKETLEKHIRTEYAAIRKPGAIKHPYPAAVALAFARALVGLRQCVANYPELSTRIPYMYGSDGQITSFAHTCAGQHWQMLLRKDNTIGGAK